MGVQTDSPSHYHVSLGIRTCPFRSPLNSIPASDCVCELPESPAHSHLFPALPVCRGHPVTSGPCLGQVSELHQEGPSCSACPGRAVRVVPAYGGFAGKAPSSRGAVRAQMQGPGKQVMSRRTDGGHRGISRDLAKWLPFTVLLAVACWSTQASPPV
jgi:hypothetical protein